MRSSRRTCRCCSGARRLRSSACSSRSGRLRPWCSCLARPDPEARCRSRSSSQPLLGRASRTRWACRLRRPRTAASFRSRPGTANAHFQPRKIAWKRRLTMRCGPQPRRAAALALAVRGACARSGGPRPVQGWAACCQGQPPGDGRAAAVARRVCRARPHALFAVHAPGIPGRAAPVQHRHEGPGLGRLRAEAGRQHRRVQRHDQLQEIPQRR